MIKIYEKRYNFFIERAKNRIYKFGKYEKHHIKPKSIFPELKKNKNNIVFLTPKEHYLVHYLLTKIYDNKEIRSAYVMMSGIKRYGKPISLKKYEEMKKEFYQQKINNGKKVINLDTGEVFPSMRAVGRCFDTESIGQLRDVLNDKWNTYKGFHWAYYNKDKKLEEYVIKKKNNRFISVKNIDTGEIFESIKLAEEKTGIFSEHITNCCKGKYKSAGGYHWEYVGESKKSKSRVKNIDTGEIFKSMCQAAKKYNTSSGSIKLSCAKGTFAGGYHWEYYKEENE
jgi:hypothetical protein